MTRREEIARLYAGSPFAAPGDGHVLAGLREALRAEPPGSPDWHAARLALADCLMEAGLAERWLPRLRWQTERISTIRDGVMRGREEGHRRLVTWHVIIEADTPPVFEAAAACLQNCANATPVMGWNPGELRLLRMHPNRLVLTAYDGRMPNASHPDSIALPGGLAGLAWLYFRLREGPR